MQLRKIASKASLSYKLQLQAKNVDFKLTFVPLVFIFLRIWGTILGIIHIYISSDFRESKLNAVFVLFSVSSTFCLFVCLLDATFKDVSAYLVFPLTKGSP